MVIADLHAFRGYETGEGIAFVVVFVAETVGFAVAVLQGQRKEDHGGVAKQKLHAGTLAGQGLLKQFGMDDIHGARGSLAKSAENWKLKSERGSIYLTPAEVRVMFEKRG